VSEEEVRWPGKNPFLKKPGLWLIGPEKNHSGPWYTLLKRFLKKISRS
jgi:hypothetical protein